MKKLLILLITGYKYFISPIFVQLGFSGCRFRPTCSEFALWAVKKYGVQKGAILTAKRLAHCQPFGKIYD